MITIGLVVVGAVLVSIALIYPSIKPVGDIVVPPANPRPMADGNAMGDPNAPVTIIEYSDYQCPYCRFFSEQTEQLIVETYVQTGKVYFIYRSMGNFVSDNIAKSTGVENTESSDAAEAAHCAGEQDKFWEYHDILFANQTGEGVGAYAPRRLKAFAESLDLDMNAFNECFDSHKYQQVVEQEGLDGRAAGVTGTPSFVINGELFSGAQPFDAFREVIETALIAAGQ
ncbi:MAG: DsbA family protein [Chloroflexi bacterium]|nr:DsbA family protein [Chloroflexota bacterium]